MPHDRFFADNQRLHLDDHFEIEGEEFNHLVRVMRVRENEVIECLNGEGRLAKVRVETIQKKAAILNVIDSKYHEKPNFSIILAQGLPRNNHLDLIVEKGCELGMTELWLFKGERSEKGDLSETQQTRIRHLLISALKQCGSLWLPKVKIMPALKDWKKLETHAYYGSLEEGVPSLKQVILDKGLGDKETAKEIIFVVGPEKGLSDQEYLKLKEIGAKGVSLHPNILRTETASIAALAVISHFMM